MVICDYCRRECFEIRTWPRNTFKSHHSSILTWTESIDFRCGICTFLANHVAKALDRISGREREQYHFTTDELKVSLERLTVLPVYRVRYHPRNIRGQVFLGFEPVHFEAGIILQSPPQRLESSLLSRQSLIAYPTETTYPGSRLAKEHGVSLARSTDSSQTIAQISAWLGDCDSCHSQCQYSKQDPSLDKMPRRLIDVGLPSQSGSSWSPIRLIETKEVQSYMTLRFVALDNPLFGLITV